MRKTKEKITQDQFTIILEDINSKLDLLVEGQSILEEKQDEFGKQQDSFEQKQDSFEQKQDNFEQKQDSFEQKQDNFGKRQDNFEKSLETFRVQTGNNFKIVFKYLIRIDNEIIKIKEDIAMIKKELKNKADKTKLNELEGRIRAIERVLKIKKVKITAKTNIRSKVKVKT